MDQLQRDQHDQALLDDVLLFAGKIEGYGLSYDSLVCSDAFLGSSAALCAALMVSRPTWA